MICVSLSHNRFDGLLNLVNQYSGRADVLEIRIDLLENPEDIDFERISSLSSPPLIYTNRLKEEGGGFRGGEKHRISFLDRAIEAGAEFIDIELATEKPLREHLLYKAKRASTKVILSWHDFKGTPDETEIEKIFLLMKDAGADIVKIVTMANHPVDFLNFRPVFQASATMNIPVIAFCMGEQGIYSRIFSLAMGGLLTFAAPDSSSGTAPGQIALSQMKEIFSKLKQVQPF